MYKTNGYVKETDPAHKPERIVRGRAVGDRAVEVHDALVISNVILVSPCVRSYTDILFLLS
jgi:hypothetical protein